MKSLFLLLHHKSILTELFTSLKLLEKYKEWYWRRSLLINLIRIIPLISKDKISFVASIIQPYLGSETRDIDLVRVFMELKNATTTENTSFEKSPIGSEFLFFLAAFNGLDTKPHFHSSPFD